MLIRPRRNRRHSAIRAMMAETSLSPSHLISPLFVTDTTVLKTPISSLPQVYRWNKEGVLKEVETSIRAGLSTFALFPVIAESLKDSKATYSYAEENFYLHIIRALKEHFPEAVLMTDVAMDPYSTDGHDGYVSEGVIVNDATLPLLGKMAVAQAQAGADIIGPSDMMDGRVQFIRQQLDSEGFDQVAIMSYTAKYASAYYGPFREALNSAPKLGDKKTYQMDPANKIEALREAELDTAEGADWLMVKPALCYLDVIHLLKQRSTVPISAYHVSGEYAMLKAACQNGWLDYDAAMPEMLLSIKRAGADCILTYAAKEYAEWFRKND